MSQATQIAGWLMGTAVALVLLGGCAGREWQYDESARVEGIVLASEEEIDEPIPDGIQEPPQAVTTVEQRVVEEVIKEKRLHKPRAKRRKAPTDQGFHFSGF